MTETHIDCPTCKTKLKVKVPDPTPADPQTEKPAFDTSALTERLAKIEEKTKALPEDFCTKFPELCSNMGAIKKDVSEMKARQAQHDEEDDHAHFAPSDELFEHWEKCPDCKGKADELAKRLADKVRAAEKAKETPAEKPPESEKESPLPPEEEKQTEEEYTPPWRRL